MHEHELRTWPEPFEAIKRGHKRHEIRRDDRGYAVGDTLYLREFRPGPAAAGLSIYTGRWMRCRVTYLTPGGAWGLAAGLCVMSIEVLSEGVDSVEAIA